jgi:hypothetical protein
MTFLTLNDGVSLIHSTRRRPAARALVFEAAAAEYFILMSSGVPHGSAATRRSARAV